MNISSWFSKMIGEEMTLDNLETVLVRQMQDLLSAEEQLIQALPKMAKAAAAPALRQALTKHLGETHKQKTRLEKAFELMNRKPKAESCDAMKGLIAEGEEIISLRGDADVKDAALIAAAQRVEHYEIAGYGCARTFARRLGLTKVAKLLQETLDEEAHADKLLTEVAEGGINAQAVHRNGRRSTRNGRSPRSTRNGRAPRTTQRRPAARRTRKPKRAKTA